MSFADSDDRALDPEDVNSSPTDPALADLADDVPVPVAMSPAEVDERAQVVESLRNRRSSDSRGRDEGMR